MNYDFLPPSRIVFGWGRRRELGALAQTLGRRALIVTGSRTLDANGVMAGIEASLREAGVEPVRLASIAREPEVEDVDTAVAATRGFGVAADDLVIGIGGGSALDLAKAVAALATQPIGHSVVDYLEGVGRGLTIASDPLPMIAMPTTAGTGTEATKNAVISSSAKGFKKSLRSDRMMPRIALVDPELTVSVPPATTAATGMDAITQLIEAFVSRRAQPIPQALCLQGLELAMPAIVEAVENGTSRPAREAMAHAALLSGLALANSGLGFAHGVAAALGVLHGVTHGLACAVMLPVAMRVNRDIARAELERLVPILLGGHRRTTEIEAPILHSAARSAGGGEAPTPATLSVDAAIDAVQTLNSRLRIPSRLSELGVTHDALPALAKASRGNSMSGNPRELSDDELLAVLEEAL